jgi:hypothetical protein
MGNAMRIQGEPPTVLHLPSLTKKNGTALRILS